MVARLNRDSSTAKKAQQMKNRLQGLMVTDAKAFKKIHTLYQKKTSCCAPVYQKALENAATPPEQICIITAQATKLALSQKNKTSQWLMSDLKESVILLKASFESARFNVNVNLKGFHDHAAAKKIDGRLNKEYAGLLKNGRRILDQAWQRKPRKY